jgi:hypothetical protein
LTTRPPVPPAGALDPLIDTLPPGTELTRVFDRRWPATSFNPTEGSARFRPVRDRVGAVVPTAYLGSDRETALSEVLLRGVSALVKTGVPRRLYRYEVEGYELCPLVLTRAVRVARLHGAGLTRLGLVRAHVIDCQENAYDYTAAWAQALWGSRRRPAGLAWTSRQSDSGRAFMLWEARVPEGTLERLAAPVALDREPGLDLVRRACALAGIDFEG